MSADVAKEPHKEKKIIVFESNLLERFKYCRTCKMPTQLTRNTIGSFLSIKVTCEECGEKWTWRSQPHIANYPAGNILLSAGILLSGLSASRALIFLDHCHIQHQSYGSYLYHQKKWLFPTINKIWDIQQSTLLQRLQAEDIPLELAGDGRADSPGHSGTVE